MNKSLGFTVLQLLAACVIATEARADWRFVVLQPADARESTAWGAGGARQGGYASVFDGVAYRAHPVIWNASSDDPVDLLPEPWSSGYVYDLAGDTQVGFVHDGTNPHAALWSGTPASFLDLNPTQYSYSTIYAISGGQQVGFVGPAGPLAAVWFGSPESCVRLHPTSMRWSEAWATDGQVQGGRASIPFIGTHACLWRGTADSFVDMNPEGARESIIRGAAVGVQVGWALFSTREFAALWRGSPESFLNLHPSDGYTSRLYATTGELHAGYVNYTGSAEAGIWIGDDPESFINLHRYVGPEYYASAAHAIVVDGGLAYVAGTASHTQTSKPHAVLWIGRAPGNGRLDRFPRGERVPAQPWPQP